MRPPSVTSRRFTKTLAAVAGATLALAAAAVPGHAAETVFDECEVEIVEFAAGDAHSLALDSEGDLWAWGDNWRGQLGLGDEDNRPVPTRVTMAPAGITALAAGYRYSLALTDDGTVWSWGAGGRGQLGNNQLGHVPGYGAWRASPGTVEDSGPDGAFVAQAIAAGKQHALAVADDGSVWSWGDNGHRQLGRESADFREALPGQVDGTSDGFGAVAVAGGYQHSLALTDNGEVWAWGSNGRGQLGVDDWSTPFSVEPVKVTGFGRGIGEVFVEAISAAQETSFALDSDGYLWSWGDSTAGILGDGTEFPRWEPDKVLEYESGDPLVADSVSAQAMHSLAVGADGFAWAWGVNWYGQLGDGTDEERFWADLVRDEAGEPFAATAVATGGWHSLALDDVSQLWAWGGNWNGQLGDPLQEGDAYWPVPVWPSWCREFPVADLGIEISVTPTAPVVGQPFTYTLTVTNYGPDAATPYTVRACVFEDAGGLTITAAYPDSAVISRPSDPEGGLENLCEGGKNREIGAPGATQVMWTVTEPLVPLPYGSARGADGTRQFTITVTAAAAGWYDIRAMVGEHFAGPLQDWGIDPDLSNNTDTLDLLEVGYAPATERTLTFNANGGTVTPTSRPQTVGEPVGTLPTPTRSGCTFQGWFTAGGTHVTPTYVMPNHAVTVTARWNCGGGGGNGGGGEGTVTRLAGPNRYGTAAAISAATFGPGVPVAYIASGLNFPDAATGAVAAALSDGPVLLTQPGALPAATRTELARLRPARIVVFGGSSAISDAVLAELDAFTTGTVTRHAGGNRFGTAAAISAATFPNPGVPVAFVAAGDVFPDALTGAAMAANLGGPVLLTHTGWLPNETITELQRLQPGRIVVLGGTAAVSQAVAEQLGAYTAGAVTRVAGANRFGTAAAISAATFPSPGVAVAYIAVGTNWPDALTGAVPAALDGGPVLLTRTNQLPPETIAELARLRPRRIVILGGTSAVSPAVAKALAAYATG